MIKNPLLYLCLIPAVSLIGQESSFEECCSCPASKCIDCQSYMPPYADRSCNCWDLFVDGEFLYWYAREVNLPLAIRVLSIPNVPGGTDADTNFTIVAREYIHIDVDWDPGLRVGVGWNPCCTGWDYYLNWTYFRNTASTSPPQATMTTQVPLAGEDAYINLWENQSYQGGSTFVEPYYKQISARWKLRLNIIDLELGYKYWLSNCLNIRPYIGLRGAWTRTTFEVKSEIPPAEILPTLVRAERNRTTIKNRNWGVGFLAGLQPNWVFCKNLCRSFSIYGNVDFALLWGEFEGNLDERNVLDQSGSGAPLSPIIDVPNKLKESYFTMQPFLDLAIGLRWEEFWCCNRLQTTLDVGWEHHIWFQHGQYNRHFGNSNIGGGGPGAFNYITNSKDTEHSLDYGGLVVRLRLDF